MILFFKFKHMPAYVCMHMYTNISVCFGDQSLEGFIHGCIYNGGEKAREDNYVVLYYVTGFIRDTLLN